VPMDTSWMLTLSELDLKRGRDSLLKDELYPDVSILLVVRFPLTWLEDS
jgi:hypothetical protein